MTSGSLWESANPVLQQIFQGAAAVGGQVGLAGTTSQSQAITTPIPIPATAPTSNLSSSVPGGAALSLQELEGRFKDKLKVEKEMFLAGTYYIFLQAIPDVGTAVWEADLFYIL